MQFVQLFHFLLFELMICYILKHSVCYCGQKRIPRNFRNGSPKILVIKVSYRDLQGWLTSKMFGGVPSTFASEWYICWWHLEQMLTVLEAARPGWSQKVESWRTILHRHETLLRVKLFSKAKNVHRKQFSVKLHWNECSPEGEERVARQRDADWGFAPSGGQWSSDKNTQRPYVITPEALKSPFTGVRGQGSGYYQ